MIEKAKLADCREAAETRVPGALFLSESKGEKKVFHRVFARNIAQNAIFSEVVNTFHKVIHKKSPKSGDIWGKLQYIQKVDNMLKNSPIFPVEGAQLDRFRDVRRADDFAAR